MRGQPPTPAVLWDLLLDLDALSHDLGTAYEEAHGYAYDRRDQPTDENKDEHVSVSTLSNSTRDVALDHSKLRDRLAESFYRLLRVKTDLVSGRKALTEAFTPTIGEDRDYEPLKAYVTPSDKETQDKRDADRARERRAISDEISRLENRVRRLKHRQRQLA